MRSALDELGYKTNPLLCRVRWGKAPAQETPFTHYCLSVVIPNGGGTYLADVGFGGNNSIAPVDLGSDVEQILPEGVFHVAKRDGYSYLEVQDREVRRRGAKSFGRVARSERQIIANTTIAGRL